MLGLPVPTQTSNHTKPPTIFYLWKTKFYPPKYAFEFGEDAAKKLMDSGVVSRVDADEAANVKKAVRVAAEQALRRDCEEFRMRALRGSRDFSENLNPSPN